VPGRGDGLDGLDIDAVDLGHLLQQERHQLVGGQLDRQLVDGPPGAPFEDVDADHVTTDGTDPAGHRPQSPRAVGQPEAKDVGAHGPGRYAAGVDAAFPGHDGAANHPADVLDRAVKCCLA
jgi:hypothetical protein